MTLPLKIARNQVQANRLACPSRGFLIASLAISTVTVACSSTYSASASEEPYCYRNRFNQQGVCTSQSVPSAAKDAQAKRFESDPNVLKVYVLRRSWGDTRGTVPLQVDGKALAALIPDSMIEIRLPPGEHELVFSFAGQSSMQKVSGQAGEVLLTGIDGANWAWSTKYSWGQRSQDEWKVRARHARLIGQY